MSEGAVDDHVERVARLERRVERERVAREEAERIAEDGMRALYEANVQLDRRIAERTAELDAALAAAEASSRALRSVLVGLSHSLATPLNGVRGMLELLEEVATEEPAKGWHASATRSAHRLDRLVQRLLRHVGIEEVDLRSALEPATVRDVLFALEDRWRGRLASAGQLLVVDAGPMGDESIGTSEELFLAFDELLHNVRIHADPGQVNLTSVAAEGPLVRIEIRDPGPGLPDVEEDVDAERLTRAGDHGSQLGFVLIDRIIEGLGGRFVRRPGPVGVVAVELPRFTPA
ncbi:MAG: histidine kinase dimerization/phospho-acceptor domain-containing protein [Actinomycetota bacterium]